MSTIDSIPKIYRLGDKNTENIFSGPVVVEEKYDGSQFTFGEIGGKLICRSKGTLINPDDAGMFGLAVETAKKLFNEGALDNGALYLCEYISKQKHNVLNYAKVPASYLVLYDVRLASGQWLDSEAKLREAGILNLHPVKLIWYGCTAGDEENNFLDQESSLGGTKVEGYVIKNYALDHAERPGYPRTAKVVSDQFKERMQCRPHKLKAGPGEAVTKIINALRTEPRWLKTIQHLRESGQLTDSAKDIGPLLKALNQDLLTEETDWIKQQLFDAYWKQISKGVAEGFPRYYQDMLAGGVSSWQKEVLRREDDLNGKDIDA